MGKKGTRREKLIIKAINPENGQFYPVTISHAKIHSVANISEGKVKEAAYCVPKILQRPTAIFRGLKRELDEPFGTGEGRLCYCGIPDVAYNKDGTECEPRPESIFLIFVSNERVAYNWYWTNQDSSNADLPEDYSERFREQLL